jgi:hypothetical protein
VEAGSAEEVLLALSLTGFEPPNQRLFRALEEADGARLTASVSTVEASTFPDSFSLSNACVKLDLAAADVFSVACGISTSSASRHHFRRRV